MRLARRIATIVGWLWVSAFFCVFIVSNVFIIVDRGFVEWWRWGQEVYSPFNVVNFLVVMVTIGPGALLITWGDSPPREK